MNWDRIEGNWKQYSGKVQQKWGKLTDSDLQVIKGKRTELVGRIQERYGIAKDEAEKQVNEYTATFFDDQQTDLGHGAQTDRDTERETARARAANKR